MFTLFSLLALVSAQTPPNPETIAFRVANTIFQSNYYGTFVNPSKWGYGPALATIGLFEVLDTFTDNTTETNYIFGNISKALDYYYAQGREAYNVTNNIIMPYEGSIGDHLGLYPVTYLLRYEYLTKKGVTPNANDTLVATKAATQYIFGFPTKTTDGIIARNSCWSGESGTCLWGDDMFMGMALVCRLATYLKNQTYVTWAANNDVGFAKHMQEASTGIFYHGYGATNSVTSCCKWSRANGWAIMSHTEQLLAFESFPANNLQTQVLTIYQNHCAAFKRYQDSATGLFRQVVNDTNIWLETSSTAMVTFSLATGIIHKWITDADYGTVVDKAWSGVASTVQADGTVNGICEGCGIQSNEQGYADRSTAFGSSSPGLGSVFRAAAAYGQLLKFRSQVN